MRRRLRRQSAAAAAAAAAASPADPGPPKRPRTRGRYDRCGSSPAVAAGVWGTQASTAAHPAGPFFTGGFAVASLISRMASGTPKVGNSVLRVEGWLNVWAINGVQRLYLFDDGAVPTAAWQPKFCALVVSEQMIHHHCSEVEYSKTASSCSHRRIGGNYGAFCKYWKLPFTEAQEPDDCLEHGQGCSSSAAPATGFGFTKQRKTSLSSTRGRDSSYDRALDEERRGSLPASIGSTDATPASSKLFGKDVANKSSHSIPSKNDMLDCPDYPAGSSSTVNGSADVTLPPPPPSPSTSRPVGLYMKKGIKQAVQNIRRASSIGRLDKKKPATTTAILSSQQQSTGTSPSVAAAGLGSSSPHSASPKNGLSAQQASASSATKVDASADSGWSAVSLYSRLKRSMSLSKLTRKRSTSRLEEGSVVVVNSSTTSSKLKTALSCESLLAATAAGMTPSSADIGEGNVQVHLVHPSVIGQDNCFQIVTETGGTTFYACQSPEERDQWMACIRRAINPGGDKSHRTYMSLKLCVQEAKNILPKKKYFCEITLDKTVYARTSVKAKMDMLFWGEQFEFDNLPEVATISVTLYRDTEKKKRLDRNVNIGYVSVPICCLANHQVMEKWYPLVVSAPSGGLGRSASKPEPQPQIRLKTRYQKLHILPLAFYAELLHYVQTNYMHLVDNLEPLLSVRAKDDIAAVLVSIMLSEGRARDFLCDIVMADVLKQDNRHLTFRSNTIATKAVEAYMKIVGRKYLRTVLSDFVRIVLDSSDDCEVDPAKLHASGSGILQRQQLNLLKHCETAWSRISSSVTEFPRELQEVFTSLRTRSNEIGKADVADNLISSCVFLRFLCPAIMSPSLFNLCQDFPDEKSARALTLVAKTIQSLANFSKFGGKEDYMLHMNDFVEREWSHMQTYLHHISTTDSKHKLTAAAATDYPLVDLGKELSMLHALLGDELKTGAPGSDNNRGTTAECAAATIEQPQPLDGLHLVLRRISNELACPKSALSVSVSTGSGCRSSPNGPPDTAAFALAPNANDSVSTGREATPAVADAQAKLSAKSSSPSNDYVEFAWKQPPRPGSSAVAASSSAWTVGATGLETNASVTNANETRSTAKPVEIAEQPMAFTSPASLRTMDSTASPLLSENRQKESTVLQHPTGRNPLWQQHTLSGDYVDLVSLTNTSVHEALSSGTTQEDDRLSTTSSSSRTATPSSGYASCNAGIADESLSSGNRSGLSMACIPQKKELYGSREGSPVLNRPAQVAVPRIASSGTSTRQPTSSPLVFINVGYQHRPSTGGPLSSRSPRKAGALPEEQSSHSPLRTTSPSVVTQQALPTQTRFQALPNRYGSLNLKPASKGSPAKPESKVSVRAIVQSQMQAEDNAFVSSMRSDQQLASQPARPVKVAKSIDGKVVSKPSASLSAQTFSNSCRDQRSSLDAMPAVRDEKRYGCAAFSSADLDSPAQPMQSAKAATGRGAGSATSSRRTEPQQQPQEYRARAYSSSSADERVGAAFGGGCDGSGGETPPSERSWSSSQGSFTSASARTLQRKLEEHQNVKQEHEGLVEVLKSQLEEAQRRLEETEERLARQAEQTNIAMSEWRQRLDASEAKLHAQQKEKDEQMQAILERLQNVEEDLRREQQEMKGSILQRQRMIELQERRIEQLDVANARLLGTLQQLKDKVSGNRTASSSIALGECGGEQWASVAGKPESSVSDLAASSTAASSVASSSAVLGERLQPAQTAPSTTPQQTTYKTILYYSHDSGKSGFV